MVTGPPPLLTAVKSLWAAQPALQSLDHVARSIDAFLDGSGRYDVAQAVATGSLGLLQRVLFRLERDEEMDPFLREQLIRRGFSEAIRRQARFTVEQIHSCHPGYLAVQGLSIAAAALNVEMFQWLYDHRPDEHDCISRALADAATNGCIGIIRWVAEKEDLCSVCPSAALRNAVVHGHVEIAEFLISRGVRAKMHTVGDGAAANGHLAAVKWLHESDFEHAFTSEAMTAAAGAGHLEVVQFLHENRTEGCRSRAMDGAATAGRLDIVKYLYDRRSEGCTARAVNGAAKNGHLHVLLWLYEHFPSATLIWTSQAATNALTHGQYAILNWLSTELPDLSEKLPPFAALEVAKEGNLRGLQMLHDVHGPDVRWSPRVMEVAAASGDLTMVKWLYENRPKENWMTAMDRAAENGHLHVVEYMHSRGALGSPWAMNKAAGSGHLRVVQWLHENRSEGCTTEAMNMAAEAGHLDVVKWLHHNRTEGCTTEAMDVAAASGHLEVVIWLHKNRHEGCTEEAFAGHGNWEVIRWLVENRRDVLPRQALHDAAATGRIRILDLLVSRFGLRVLPEDIVRAAASGHLSVVQWAVRFQLQESADRIFEPTQCRDHAEVHGHFHIVDWLEKQS